MAQNPWELSHHSAVTRMLLETKPNGFWLLWAELLREHHHLVSITQERWSQGRDPAGAAQISALWGLGFMRLLPRLSPLTPPRSVPV